jgi:hypothetical protein
MPKLENKADLERLIKYQVEENITLEYKASPALNRQNRDEICKDVSAFANSTGGQIVYGIVEEERLPKELDEGVDAKAITREWIEQIINSNIQPRIRGVVITPIQLTKDRYAYVITIPSGSTAHQAPDKKYYRRFNFQSVAMHDHEIRDVMKRSTTAEPFITLRFDGGNVATTQAVPEEERARAIPLYIVVGNRSPEPAFHTLITIGIDAQLEITDYDHYDRAPPTQTSAGHHLNQIRRRVSVPEFLPIFEEAEFQVGEQGIGISFEFRIPGDEYLIRCTVQTPGFSSTEDWLVRRSGTKLTLEGPLPPIHPL